MNLFYTSEVERIWHKGRNGNVYRLDNLEKLVLIKDQLSQKNEFEIVPVLINDSYTDLLKTVHDSNYVEALKSGNPIELAQSSGLMWQSNLLKFAVNSTESLYLSSLDALKNGRSGTISRGGHHAVSTRGFGFNEVNSIAICVKRLLRENTCSKIAVIDLDAHMGNGLQEQFANLDGVYLFDLWSTKLSEWGKERIAPNIYSRMVRSTKEYFSELQIVIDDINNISPDLVIYHSGMDIFEKDRLAGISGFNSDLVVEREKKVITSLNVPFTLVLGGGYVQKIAGGEYTMDDLVHLHIRSFEILKESLPIK